MSLSSSACPAVLSELPDPPGTSVPSEPFGADAPRRAVPNVGRPVGVFDSGVGGLTVLQAMLRRMPHEDYLYLGDTARLPYGAKSRETVIRYAARVSAFLVEQRVKALVIACNTATSAALPALRAAYPHIPVIGVIEPGAEAACRASVSGHIAVIATPATIRDGSYPAAILRRRPEARVKSLACPLFVPMAEDGLFEGPLAEGLAARYLSAIFPVVTGQDDGRGEGQGGERDRPDCLVLGCTHYPLLAGAIRRVVGKGVTLVDSAATTAEAACRVLTERGLARSARSGGGTCRFFTTDDPERFARTGRLFLDMPLGGDDVTLVDL